VSQQALSQRFLNFPAEIFQRVLMDFSPPTQPSQGFAGA